MDAVKFIKENSRMCRSYDNCSDCPAFMQNNKKSKKCEELKRNDTEYYVSIVEKWSAEHPIKTRQSEMLKMFPNATLDAIGSLDICPAEVDKDMNCRAETGAKCLTCRKNFWLEEVE